MCIRLAPSLLAIAAAGVAAAAETDVIEVGATRLGADLFEQPYAQHQVTRAALDEDNRRTLSDAIDRAPGVWTQRTAGNQASPYIRGLTGQQTLLLFDGVRLNNALFRPGPNQYAAMVPEEAVGRVDVILGSGTTVLGSDGLTGAIDYRLAEAGRGLSAAASPAAWAKGRWGSAEGGGGALGIDGRVGDIAYSLEGALASYGETRGGSRAGERLFGDRRGQRDIPNTDYEQGSAGLRLAWLGSDNHRITLAAGRVVQSSAERPDGYEENSGSIRAISRHYDPQTFTYAHLRHRSGALGAWDRTQTTLWYHRHDETQYREDYRNNAQTQYRRRIYEDSVGTLGIDVQLTNLTERHEFTYGLTAYQDRISSRYEEYRENGIPAGTIPSDPAAFSPQNWSGLSTVPDGARFTGLAGFAQDHWTLAEDWSLLAGLRWDRVAWTLPITATRPGYAQFGTGEIDGDAQAASGSLRLSWRAAEPLLTWAGLGQGFRAPTASDLAGTQDRASASSGTGPQTEGNPYLDPETSLTLEWGVRFEHEQDSASLSLFRTRLDDLIQTQYIDANGDGQIIAADGDRARRVNATSGVLQGGEVACDIGLPVGLPAGWRLAVFQATSLVDGEVEVPQLDGSDREQHLSRANTLTGRAGLRLAETGRWYALAQVRWADRYDEPSPDDAGDVRFTVVDPRAELPGWAVVDVKAGVQGRAWRVDAGVENVGDITYRQAGSGADGAGINAVASAQVRF